VQIGLVEPYNPGLTQGDTEVVLEHRLEYRPCYPISVDEDAARHAGAHRLEEIFVALGDNEDLAVLQVPALQFAIGEVYREIPSAPGRASLVSSKKAISGSPCPFSPQSA
jgi:hypothetical protein